MRVQVALTLAYYTAVVHAVVWSLKVSVDLAATILEVRKLHYLTALLHVKRKILSPF